MPGREFVAKVDAKAHMLEEIFSNFYVIPDFQREYIWKPRHVRVLLTDLHTAWATGGDMEYFLGSLVVYDQDGKQHVVDGQQRLTTLFVMLAIIRDRLKALKGDDLTVEVIENALRNVAMVKGRGVNRLRLEHNIPEMVSTLTAIVNGHGGQLPTPKTSHIDYNLVQAYLLIEEFIVTTFGSDADRLGDFFGFMWGRIELIKVSAQDLKQAFIVFETINFRGVTLDAMDLMKNLLFKEAAQAQRKGLQEKWRSMLGHLREAGELRPIRFLRYHLLTLYEFERMPTTSDLFNQVTNPKVAKKLGYLSDPGGFVDQMVEAAQAYGHINRGDGPDGSANAYVEGIKLHGSGVKQHLCLLLAGRHLNASAFNELAARLEALMLVYAVVGIQWNTVESKLPAWAPAIRALKTTAEVRSWVEANIEPLIGEEASNFWERIDRTDRMKPKLLRYILASLTQAFELDSGKDVDLEELLKRTVTIEHIFSQKPREDAIIEFKPSQSRDIGDYTYALGNLMLLHGGANAVASNEPYSVKLETYENAAVYDLSRSVFKNIAFGSSSTKSAKALRSWGLAHSTKWNPESLKKRHDAIQLMASEIWGIPLPAGG
jgi:hypothetical protein